MRNYVGVSIPGRQKGDGAVLKTAVKEFIKAVGTDLGMEVETGTVKYYYMKICRSTHAHLVLHCKTLSSKMIQKLCEIADQCGLTGDVIINTI